ncbi:MAG: hypothetical protein C3F06_08280 [Candidatus Methanoperedenaceae archaeon]|nr:MAG: hypothetical protein C3F06_08280 [Candidatus Methanoperedenaceae archaeon]
MEQDKWLYHNTLKWKGEKKADLKFIESANVCYMTTLLGTMKNMGVELISYESRAEGILETVDKMKIFTRIIIRPRIKARDTEAKIRLILNHAEKRCLVANSMKTQVIIEPEIEPGG